MSDLTELFARDPLELSKQDLATIVRELRAKRAQFNLGNNGAGSMKPKSGTAKAAAEITEKLGLKLNL